MQGLIRLVKRQGISNAEARVSRNERKENQESEGRAEALLERHYSRDGVYSRCGYGACGLRRKTLSVRLTSATDFPK